jgi:hypothetical protein
VIRTKRLTDLDTLALAYFRALIFQLTVFEWSDPFLFSDFQKNRTASLDAPLGERKLEFAIGSLACVFHAYYLL